MYSTASKLIVLQISFYHFCIDKVQRIMRSIPEVSSDCSYTTLAHSKENVLPLSDHFSVEDPVPAKLIKSCRYSAANLYGAHRTDRQTNQTTLFIYFPAGSKKSDLDDDGRKDKQWIGV